MTLKIPGTNRRSSGGKGDVPMVTRQLATLLKAGIPLSDALGALIQQIEHRSLERSFRQIKEDIASGSPTGDAFARHPQYFNNLYVNMIKAGEASGNMDEVLKRLSDFLQKQAKMKGKVSAALVYPLAMLVLGGLVVLFLMSFVVPKIVDSIKERGMPLPAPTEILIAISGFVKAWWWAIIIFMFVASAVYGMWVRTPQGRLTRDTWLLKLPIFGLLFKKQSVARFATTFSTLLKSGLPALECLKILRDVVDNALLAKTLDEVHDRIIEGADIATPLKNSGVFPPVVGYMISIGEQSGQLEDILDKVAESYDEEIDVTTQKVTALIEPVIIVFMALVVGFIVLSVVLPLVQGFNV
jgi:general secretion pathway protein F